MPSAGSRARTKEDVNGCVQAWFPVLDTDTNYYEGGEGRTDLEKNRARFPVNGQCSGRNGLRVLKRNSHLHARVVVWTG